MIWKWDGKIIDGTDMFGRKGSGIGEGVVCGEVSWMGLFLGGVGDW